MIDGKTGSGLIMESDSYMSPLQLEYFREKLLRIKSELKDSIRKNLIDMNENDSRPIEVVERSSMAVEKEIEIQNQSRNWLMNQSVNQALERINDGSYGYCIETEEPIGIKRLEANPTALYCLDVQEEHEMAEKRLKSRM